MIRIRIWNPDTNRARVWRVCHLTGIDHGDRGQVYLRTEVVGTGERVTIELEPSDTDQLVPSQE